MRDIYEHRRVVRQTQRVPVEILKRYEIWKDIVAISGPAGLRVIRGLNDEALPGKGRGHRSYRLGQQYRVIHRIERDVIRVEVVTITPHDYRRK